MDIGIVGMGLIGGSLALTIKLRTKHRVFAWNRSPEPIEQARLVGAIDGVLDEERLRGCRLVLVCLYPAAIVDWVKAHADSFGPGTVVIDCAGVKGCIMRELAPLAHGRKWRFIGGHPMAGREFSGFKYARDDLYDNASMILTPAENEDTALLMRVRDFFMDLGFRRVQFTTPEKHDEMIAYTSQLAHIVSGAYVRCPHAEEHRGFSAGSFADMTRVARANADMWTELFFDNRAALSTELEGLIGRLQEYADALRDGDRERMHALIEEGSAVKERLTQP